MNREYRLTRIWHELTPWNRCAWLFTARCYMWGKRIRRFLSFTIQL